MLKNTQLFIILAVIAGMLVPLQGALNGTLGQTLKHPLQATLISFVGGVIAVGVLLLFVHPNLPKWDILKTLPWYLFIGGFLGAVFVTSALLAVPKIGATSFLAASLLGQMIGSLVIDHFGLLNVPVHQIDLKRIGGILLIGFGMWLVNQKS